MNNIAKTILEESVDFDVEISKPTIFHHLKLVPIKKKFRIYPLCLGTMLLIAKLIDNVDNFNFKQRENETYLEAVIKSIIHNTDLISDIIALAIWNRKYSDHKVIRYFQEKRISRISKYIQSNLNPKEVLIIVNLIIDQMEIEHFLACMVSMKGMTVLPKNVIETKKKDKKTKISGN